MENQGFEPRIPEVEDLQSPEVANASHSPNFMVDRGRIELPIEACKATVIPFNYQPKFLATRDGIEPPLEVLETSALPLY